MGIEQQIKRLGERLASMHEQPEGTLLSIKYDTTPHDQDMSLAQVLGTAPIVGAISGTDSLRLRYTTPDGEETMHLPNPNFGPRNPSVQFLAAIGLRPSDIEGETHRFEHSPRIPLVYNDAEDRYMVAQTIIEHGKDQLVHADWNEWDEADVGIETGE